MHSKEAFFEAMYFNIVNGKQIFYFLERLEI